MPLLEATDIPPARLLLLLVPLLLAGALLRRQRPGLERRLGSGMLRAAVQLSALGLVLAPLLGLGRSPLVLLVLGVMCCLAAFFSLGVLRKGPGLSLWHLAVVTILPIVVGLVAFALLAVVPGGHVLDARYAVTLGGMLAGICMNSVALAGERFVAGLEDRRAEVELSLLLGATPHEATRRLRGAAVLAAVTPSLNSLVAVGLVSIPGMMTGQIIGGGDPLVAARYQVMVMALWVSAAALAASVFVQLVPRRLMACDRLHLAPPALQRPSFEPGPPAAPPEGPLVYEERPPDPCAGGAFSDVVRTDGHDREEG